MNQDSKTNPNYYKLIIIGDDGIYELNEDKWKTKENEVTDEGTITTVTELRNAGSYLAFLDPNTAAGAGMACTVVNLSTVLKNNLRRT